MENNNTTKKKAQSTSTTNVSSKRFRYILIVMCVIGVAILFTALKTMLTKREYWEEVRQQFTTKNITEPAIRGNIYDCNNRLLVGSVPEYRLCMDFNVKDDNDTIQRNKVQHFRDSVYLACKDSIAMGLHAIFPQYSQDFFLKRMEEGHRRKKNGWCILPPHLATFIEYQECKKLPLFRESELKGGFHGDKIMKRKKPYGSLASRTLGIITDSTISGIEAAYDTILRGTDGIKHISKVRDTRVPFTDKEPINGHDLVSTIDVEIQDVAEKSLMAQLKKLGPDAEMGCVIVMEAKTGDVKAMANLGQITPGVYAEIYNYSISECIEPGSTFKTASIMAALEDGLIDTSDVVDIHGGVAKMHGRMMKDAAKGRYQMLSVKRIMEKSSNVGVSTIIDKHYGNNKKAFVDALYREGAGIELNLPLPGARNPIMKRDPDDKSNWWSTTLPWMSIGYESLLPPISTCTFYNGIANNGVLVKPRFVKAELEDGKVVREFPIEVLREHMCSPNTLQKIREVLENVVSAPGGTGKKARCPQFRVAGKTGTAQIASGKSGYRNGKMRYFVSFCGFFPYENPKYTCFVGIRIYNSGSGGGNCGPVFSQVAQAVMATGMNHREPKDIVDSTATKKPTLKGGNAKETQYILENCKIPYHTQKESEKSASAEWYKAENGPDSLKLSSINMAKDKMPDVKGMGARDAVYALRKAGVKVKLKGAGHVTSQSIEPGTAYKKGVTVSLTLSN